MPESYEPGQYEYHYDRDARLSRQSEWMKKQMEPRSFFQRNRMFIIIFADIIFIVMVFMIFNPFSLLGTPRLEGYLLKTRAFYFDNEIMVSLTVSPGKRALSRGIEGEGLLFEISLSKEIDDSALAISDVISLEGEKKLRLSMETPDPPKNIYGRVTIGTEQKDLKIPLEKE